MSSFPKIRFFKTHLLDGMGIRQLVELLESGAFAISKPVFAVFQIGVTDLHMNESQFYHLYTRMLDAVQRKNPSIRFLIMAVASSNTQDLALILKRNSTIKNIAVQSDRILYVNFFNKLKNEGMLIPEVIRGTALTMQGNKNALQCIARRLSSSMWLPADISNSVDAETKRAVEQETWDKVPVRHL